MPNAFDFSASPFDCLDADEQRIVRDSVDVAYFRADETLLDPGIEPLHLFVVIKGHVTQFDGDEPVTTFGPGDRFDGRSLVAGRATSSRCLRSHGRRVLETPRHVSGHHLRLA